MELKQKTDQQINPVNGQKQYRCLNNTKVKQARKASRDCFRDDRVQISASHSPPVSSQPT